MEKRMLHTRIVTPYKAFFEGEVDMVILTSKEGELGVQPGHIPMMAALIPGEIRLKIGQQTESLVATNGYAEVGSDFVVVVVNAAEWGKNIDIPRAEKALQRAAARYNDPATDKQEKIHARHGIERAKARLKVARKYKQ